MHEVSESSERDSKFKVVYTIVDRGENKKSVWIRIGAAFVNRDQSMTVKLDAHPQNGMLHIRDYVPWEDRRSMGDEGGAHRRDEGSSQRAPGVG